MRSRYSTAPRSSARSAPVTSRPKTRIEFDEPSPSGGDSGWTVGYLDVLLLLVTLFAALLGMTYLQQPPVQEEVHISHETTLSALINPPSALETPPTLATPGPSQFWPTPVIITPPVSDTRPIATAADETSEPVASPPVVALEPTLITPPAADDAATPAEPEIPAEFERLITWLANHDTHQDLELLLDRDQLRIEVGNEILFPSGSATLSSTGQALLADLTDLMLNDQLKISIEGHTDDVPINTPRFPSNWELSSIRATSVAHALMARGVDRQRLRVTGYADTRPRVPNDSADNRALNRRVSLVLELTP